MNQPTQVESKNVQSNPIIIYVWLGKKLPNYAYQSIIFAHKNNPENEILLITDAQNVPKKFLLIDKLKLVKHNPSFLGSWKYPSLPQTSFWLNTAKRLEVVNTVCREFEIESFYHAELDNILFPLNLLHRSLDQYAHGLFVVRDNLNRALASFLYCNDLTVLDEFQKYFLPPYYPNNEMEALGFFVNNSPKVHSLPTESHINHSKIWQVVPIGVTNGIFDANSIGQYLFGLSPMNSHGIPIKNLFVNENMDVNLDKIRFLTLSGKLYFKVDESQLPCQIYNLHVHSKLIRKAIKETTSRHSLFLSKVNRRKILTVGGRYQYALYPLRIIKRTLSRIHFIAKLLTNILQK